MPMGPTVASIADGLHPGQAVLQDFLGNQPDAMRD
jgi:hypothetical protein